MVSHKEVPSMIVSNAYLLCWRCLLWGYNDAYLLCKQALLTVLEGIRIVMGTGTWVWVPVFMFLGATRTRVQCLVRLHFLGFCFKDYYHSEFFKNCVNWSRPPVDLSNVLCLKESFTFETSRHTSHRPHIDIPSHTPSS